jgi:hypothetical protein
LCIDVLEAGAIDGVLVGTGNVPLIGADVVGEHGNTAGRRNRDNAAEPTGRRNILNAEGAVNIVHERPAPDVRNAANGGDVLGRHDRSRGSS